jgi:surfeit locus 1 family protein
VRRFPLGLTIAFCLAFVFVGGLGVWQLKRLAWKQDLLARVEALRTAPPRPVAAVLSEAAAGRDVEYQRVTANCLAAPAPSPAAYRYAVRDGQVGWRLLTECRLAGAPFDAILLDRGLVTRFNGAMAPAAAVYPEPGVVIGVLRAPGGRARLGPGEAASTEGARVFRVIDRAALVSLGHDAGVSRPAPYLLASESEIPGAPGVVPAALPQDIPNNHLVYALTWFALAGVMAWFYGALLLRRLKGP